MSYRNDHEAALARVDALENELAKLREREAAEPQSERPPRRSRKALILYTACITALAVGVAGGGAVGILSSETAEQAAPPRPELPGSPVNRDMLTSCANAIQPTPPLDEERTDPRAEHPITIESIGRTGAPCREELRTFLDLDTLSVDEREALWKWAVREDELAGAISRIEMYYANDPYNLDHYTTARQLWLEYDRAYYSRNRALSEWQVKFPSG